MREHSFKSRAPILQFHFSPYLIRGCPQVKKNLLTVPKVEEEEKTKQEEFYKFTKSRADGVTFRKNDCLQFFIRYLKIYKDKEM